MGTNVARLLRDRRGLSTVEYIIILALIAVACIVAWQSFGEKLNEDIGQATEALPTITAPGGGG